MTEGDLRGAAMALGIPTTPPPPAFPLDSTVLDLRCAFLAFPPSAEADDEAGVDAPDPDPPEALEATAKCPFTSIADDLLRVVGECARREEVGEPDGEEVGGIVLLGEREGERGGEVRGG